MRHGSPASQRNLTTVIVIEELLWHLRHASTLAAAAGARDRRHEGLAARLAALAEDVTILNAEQLVALHATVRQAPFISIPLFSPGNVRFFSAIQLAPVGISVPALILGRTYGTYLHYERTYTTNVPTLYFSFIPRGS